MAAIALAVACLAAAGAKADDPGTLRRQAERLSSENSELAAASRSVLLELYGLESGLRRAEDRIAALNAEASAVRRERDAARARLALVQRTLTEAERRLAVRLHALYIDGEPDPLAVLLGASSLDEAIAALDTVGRLAQRDRQIVAQVKAARRDVATTVRTLTTRESELRELSADATAARADLLRARAERTSYLARLVRERRANRAEIGRLRAKAERAEARADELASKQAAEAPPIPPAPSAVTSSGTQMTVLVTGYSLSGKTATGVTAGWGVVAVDPSVIPLGSRMSIPGYGEGVAADIGSGIRGAVIDVWFPTRAQALAWGRRTVTITLF